MHNSKTRGYLPYVICTLASLFYLYEFILQVAPSVMTTQLMHDFGVGAAGISVISAFYYYAYTPMQLPAGLLYDRFGPRRVLSAAILVCTAGAFFFCSTHSVAMASAGRCLMGIGSAFSFIGALMLVSRWLPAQYFALVAGLVQLMSSIGAICGQIPIASAVNHFGWRPTLLVVACAGIVLALVVWLVVRDNPPSVIKSTTTAHTGELKRLREVLGRAQTWWIGIFAWSSWGPIVVFAMLWGIPLMTQRYNISTTMASTACSMIWLGIGIGSPLFGWLTDKMQRRCPLLILCAILAIISSAVILYIPSLPLAGLYVMLFILGLSASGQALSFALVKDNNRDHVTGTAIGFNNMIVVLSGALLQPLSGIILHAHWQGVRLNGVPFYSTHDYSTAMSVMIACGVLGLIVALFFIKETYCRKTYQ